MCKMSECRNRKIWCTRQPYDEEHTFIRPDQMASHEYCLLTVNEMQYTEVHVVAHLHMKESHSSMKVRVFSTPRVSEPQCSRPKFLKSLRMSSRSLDEMSQCLLSFISVKIHGLMRAPLKKQKSNMQNQVHRKGHCNCTGKENMHLQNELNC